MTSNLSYKKHRAAPKSRKPALLTIDDGPADTQGTTAGAIDQGQSSSSSRPEVPPYAFVNVDPSIDNNRDTISSTSETDDVADTSDIQRMAQQAFDLANASFPPLPTLDDLSGDLNFDEFGVLQFTSPVASASASIAASQHGTFFSGIPTFNPFAIDPLLTGVGSQFTEPESQTQPQSSIIYRPVPHVENAALQVTSGQAEYDNRSRNREGYFRSLLHTRSMIESGAKSNIARQCVPVLEHDYMGELFEEIADEIGMPDMKDVFEAQDQRNAHFTARLETLLSAALAAQYANVAGGVDANDLCLETRVWVMEKLNELTTEVFAWIKANEKNRTSEQSHMELPGHMVLQNSTIKKVKKPAAKGNGKGKGKAKAKK